MAIKQLKLTLQAQPQGDTDVNLTVSVDGVERFNQAVPPCDPIVLNETDPSETVEFDIDVPVLTANVANTVNLPVSVSCTNGSVKIEYFSNNFVFESGIDPAGNAFTWPGTANSYQDYCKITTQPLWNGVELLDRYNIQYNQGPLQISGPGEILVLDGETVVFDLEIDKFNDAFPLPPEP